MKADELAVLLDELLEQPDAKVVIFSQWLRMHELLVRRLARKEFGHVLFHGQIDNAKRSKLVDRFRENATCRAFLATDAGGVGLNLQHASVVVNMDLPWNPAVLEQRIGRVHRLGQSRPVQVVNLVSQGTIEEGMLSVIKFKKSLFAGVLDGGENEDFLGGSRLKRFMETVEKTTGAIPPEPTLVEPPEPDDAPQRPSTADSTATAPAGNGNGASSAPAGDPWAGLLQSGLALLQQLATAAHPPRQAAPSNASSPGLSLVRHDPATGEQYLRIPVPPPEVLDQALKTIGTLLERFRLR